MNFPGVLFTHIPRNVVSYASEINLLA